MPTVSRIKCGPLKYQPFGGSDNYESTLKFPFRHVASPRLTHGFSSLFVTILPEWSLADTDNPWSRNNQLAPLYQITCPRTRNLQQIDNHHKSYVQSTVKEIKNDSAVYRVETSPDIALDMVVINSLNLAPSDVDFLTGEARLALTGYNAAPSVPIEFEPPFVTPPKVVVFFNLLPISSQLQASATYHISATASRIDAKGFLLTIESSAEPIVGSAQACWIAYPADREHIFSTSLNMSNLSSSLNMPDISSTQMVRYNKAIPFASDVAFWKIPSVFVALHTLHFRWNAHLSINVHVERVTMSDLMCLVESDKYLYSVGVTIIAVN